MGVGDVSKKMKRKDRQRRKKARKKNSFSSHYVNLAERVAMLEHQENRDPCSWNCSNCGVYNNYWNGTCYFCDKKAPWK